MLLLIHLGESETFVALPLTLALNPSSDAFLMWRDGGCTSHREKFPKARRPRWPGVPRQFGFDFPNSTIAQCSKCHPQGLTDFHFVKISLLLPWLFQVLFHPGRASAFLLRLLVQILHRTSSWGGCVLTLHFGPWHECRSISVGPASFGKALACFPVWPAFFLMHTIDLRFYSIVSE